ncbi:4-alpha-glucanotransferase [Chitinophaga arvensicola]|uniref:4-alpha-glucanotransferase n=1 Tax=Chitinophaga arvensicola TaxID=29529 RepID=A0A1I0RS07_9BACT|nr:4-alpha-glucanotransferase [Chitinophaga arvensicola]SEW44043.1 4-alpha-glucanotransferase [Chitinophaga arvensicola]
MALPPAGKPARKAGILLHLTSLPGPFGIGDMGPAARTFADQLQKSGQRIWQVLPVNPIDAGNGSPYSALSAMAGNILLISPDLLVTEGLLEAESLLKYQQPSTSAVDFATAARYKVAMLESAWLNFSSGSFPALHAEFEAFCIQEEAWLQSYATHKALTVKYGNKPWQEWPAADRKKEATLNSEYAVIALKEQWWQFIFDRQWQQLKDYCHQRSIALFGDLPFYISHAAADVWSHRDLFLLDDKGQMTSVAGVPPDYFNAGGQRWNMPIYNWAQMKAAGYNWWLQRIRRNLHWFDLLRLDHFRAFAAYWQVPAEAPTAETGTWEPGPGSDLLQAMISAFPDNPFVAEDLGAIDAAVTDLRDKTGLPGMKVLQFAFGKDMPESEHIPHQYPTHCYAYTGTHDNNTTLGWWQQEAGPLETGHLKQYTGVNPGKKKAHLLLGRLAYASVAATAILPMQDVLGLGAAARMNTPAGEGQHWTWRMLPGEFDKKTMNRLKKWTQLYNRSAHE